MRRRKWQEKDLKELHDLLWSTCHWLFVTDEAEAGERLMQLALTPEIRQWGGQLQSFFIQDPGRGIHGLFVGGIPKVLLPPQVMAGLLDRVRIAYTPRWLAGLAPVLFVCREVPHAQVLMRALAAFIGGTRFDWTGDLAASE